MDYKIYKDSIGEIKVSIDKLWGATTQRSFENFKIGKYKMPIEVIRAMAIVKYACAMANYELGDLSKEKFSAIEDACGEILNGKLDDQFPLVVFQTGSGTQTNMNLNEVIAGFANQKLSKNLIHPNDDVNKSQSSNDTFPTALHIACLDVIDRRLIPSIKELISSFKAFESKNEDVIKIGRTHLQDAVPIKISQEFSGYRFALEKSLEFINATKKGLLEISLGATAVGTGINTKANFKNVVAKYISRLTRKEFKPSENFFHSLTMKDAVVLSHGAVKALAMDLIKIGNDIRFLACGPRCGFSEIEIPANEPGSSIMPGKVNPTQVEALTMVCAKVLGNDTTISFCASQGNFELNVYMPVIIHSFVESVNLLSDAMISFSKMCVNGIKVNKDIINKYLNNSLMLVTALNPYIGYDKASQCAKYAFKENITLKEAVLHFGYLTESEFDKIVDPKKMI